jgi:hypothetical protein
MFYMIKCTILIGNPIDAPLSSSMDSTVSPKVKTTERGLGARSLARRTLGVEGHDGALKWD